MSRAIVLPKNRSNHLGNIVAPLLLAVAAAVAGYLSQGCQQPSSSTVADAYAAEIFGCIQVSQTRAEADQCRNEVDRRYGLCGPGFRVECDLKDAGK